MKYLSMMDAKGRVLIPKHIRDAAGIQCGAPAIYKVEDGHIIIKMKSDKLC